MDNVFKFLSNFRKVDKVKNKADVRTVNQGFVNLLVYGGLIVFVLIGSVSGFRAISLYNQVETLKNQVQEYEAVSKEISSIKGGIDVSKVRQYMSDFLKVFINYESTSSDSRLQELDKYFAFSMSNYTDTVKESRALTGQSLIAVAEEEDFYIADIKLSYDTVESGQTVSRVRVLAVPFQISDGLLSIISPPYFKQEDVLLGEAEPLKRRDIDEVEQVDEGLQKSVSEFLVVFFEKYASSNETDLKLLMNESYFMGGQYVVDTIQENTLLIYKESEYVVVQVTVDFMDSGSGAVHSENFTLHLVEQDSGWYVKDLYHYFKK